ncbi:hypothetical protein [Taibaiella soli]|nr:hypothetical protein [Taibaiella soli]
MHFLFMNPGPKPEQNEEEVIPEQEQEYNTMEGSEFLDDSLRMTDQPLMPHEHFNEEDL